MACPEPTGVMVVRLLDVFRRQTLQHWQFESASVVTIGRSPDREIVIPDARISRLHVVLQNRDNQWWLLSMGQNGVQVDGQMVEECRLTDGLTFRLGQQGPVLEFCGSSVATESLANTAAEFCLADSQQMALDQDKLNEDVREIVDGDFFQNLISKASEFRKETTEG